jgi:hypothetical protein
MGRIDLPARRKCLIDDLESTRVDLIEIYASLTRKLGDAQSAQWVAATSGFGIATFIRVGDHASSISPAQLASSIQQIESEVAHVGKILARVDARLAEASR